MLALTLERAMAMARAPAGLPAGIRLSDHAKNAYNKRSLPQGAGYWEEETVSRSPRAVSQTSVSLTRAFDAASGGECDPKRIKDPRPKGRGISEQSELALLVQ